jgi:hypothetical protein
MQNLSRLPSHPAQSSAKPTPLRRHRDSSHEEDTLPRSVGSLMYAAVATRPDITFAISALITIPRKPGPSPLGSRQASFSLSRWHQNSRAHIWKRASRLHGYTDADGASQEHRHAISGFAFLIDGGAVSWASRKQELVTCPLPRPNTWQPRTPPRNVYGSADLSSPLRTHTHSHYLLLRQSSRTPPRY